MYAVMWPSTLLQIERSHLKRLQPKRRGVLVARVRVWVSSRGGGLAAAPYRDHKHPRHRAHQAPEGNGASARRLRMGGPPHRVDDRCLWTARHPRSRWIAEGVVSGFPAPATRSVYHSGGSSSTQPTGYTLSTCGIGPIADERWCSGGLGVGNWRCAGRRRVARHGGVTCGVGRLGGATQTQTSGQRQVGDPSRKAWTRPV